MTDTTFSISDMQSMLEQSFKPTGMRTVSGHQQPIFYENDHAIIFPPASDLETSAPDFNNIRDTLIAAAVLFNNDSYRTRKIIIPVMEKNSLFGSFTPRNHWVTLHYDPTTETATLVDSRAEHYLTWYSTQSIRGLLSSGLKMLRLPIKGFLRTKYHAIENENPDCDGYLTAINIEALANNLTIDKHLLTLSADDLERAIAHVNGKIKGEIAGIYQPLSTLNQTNNQHASSTDVATMLQGALAANQDASDDEESDNSDEDGLNISITSVETTSLSASESHNAHATNSDASNSEEVSLSYEEEIDLPFIPTNTSFFSPLIKSHNALATIQEANNDEEEASNSDNEESELDDTKSRHTPPPLHPALAAPVSPDFFMQIMCSNEMKMAGIILLSISFLAFGLGVIALASVAAATSMAAIGLSTTALMSIGTTTAAVGGSILAAGLFMQKPLIEKVEDYNPLLQPIV